MRILVTGSLGVLGVPLVEELRIQGHMVAGCDLRHNDDELYTRADVRNSRQLSSLFELARPEVVYHLAAEFGRKNGQDYYEELWSTNQIGTRNVIDLCLKYSSKLILAGSSEAYGNVVNVDHLCAERLLETQVANYHNEYALSKYTQEKQVEIAVMGQGLKAKVLRFFNVYGPGEFYSPYRSVVCLFCYNALKKIKTPVYAKCSRDFLYIGDWVRAVSNVANVYDQLQYSVYNIGSRQKHTIMELAREINDQVFGTDEMHDMWLISEYEDRNLAHKSPDTRRSLLELNNQPEMDFKVGIAKTLEWMRKVYQ